MEGDSVLSQENANYSYEKDASSAFKCLLDVLDINISDTEKRLNIGTVNFRDSYTVYFIETKIKDNAWTAPTRLENFSGIWRRYSEFETLKSYLQMTYPYVVTPPLPEKRAMFSWQVTTTDQFHPDFVDRRKAGLENFLLRIASHKVLSFNQVFIRFLQQEDIGNDSTSVVGYIGKADAKLKSLSVSFMLKKPDKRFEDIKNYSNELHNNISNVLKVRAKLADRVYGIHKLHANYGRVCAHWSPAEKEIGQELDKASHIFHAYASLSECLDEEEQFADQMKEYLFFSDSLRSVCKQQEMLQYEVERSDENLSAKSTQRENLLQGKRSFVSRWFASVDTDEVRDLKLQQFEGQLLDAETQCRQSSDDANRFVENAQKDIKSFQRQKVKDLKETLLLYAILQIKMCKKSLVQWQSLRECFERM